MQRADRFFSATVVAGRLHILGLARGGPWNARRLEWRQESEMDVLVNPRAGDRKVTTREDLESIVRNPSAPVRFLWIHERLVEDARRLWEANEETA